MEAPIFSPAKLKALDEANPGRQLHEAVGVEEDYIVKTHRVEGVWTHTIEHDGLVTSIPAKVLERLMKQRESVITGGNRERGKQQAASRLQKVANADQQAAES